MNVKGKTLLERIGSVMPKPKTRPTNFIENTDYAKTVVDKAVQKKRQSTLNPQADARSKALRDKMGGAIEKTYKVQKTFGIPGAK